MQIYFLGENVLDAAKQEPRTGDDSMVSGNEIVAEDADNAGISGKIEIKKEEIKKEEIIFINSDDDDDDDDVIFVGIKTLKV